VRNTILETLVAVVDVAALVSVWRSGGHSRKARTFWTIAVILLPVVGAIGWWTLGRERPRRPPTADV